MNKVKPIKLIGSWTDGYALDYHISSSIYTGVDSLGNKQFDTRRTTIGELLYKFKYDFDLSKLSDIMELVIPFLMEWRISEEIDKVLSVPASRNRRIQPVYELSNKIGEYLNKTVHNDVFKKVIPVQSKDLSTSQKAEIKQTIKKIRPAKRVLNILLVDDLFDTGQTLETCTKKLRRDPNIRKIYVLTLTKTRR